MPHVLIVDDDPSTREALAAIIGEDGLTTATAGDLREARIQLVRQTPDVVFTDLKLPDGSGSTCSRISIRVRASRSS